jgi:hypothetical protein
VSCVETTDAERMIEAAQRLASDRVPVGVRQLLSRQGLTSDGAANGTQFSKNSYGIKASPSSVWRRCARIHISLSCVETL